MKRHHILNIGLLFIMANLTAQSVCQEQLVIDNGVSGYSIGQSIFMSDCSGFFSSIELDRSDDGPALVAELIIFTGQTFIGTPRYTQTVTVPEGSGPFTINFGSGTGTLAFFEESQYAFILSNPTLQLQASSDINSYANGQMFIDVGFINNDDLWFKLNITSTLGLADLALKKLSVLPNPSSDYFRISGIDSDASFIIYNVLGTEVLNGVVSEDGDVDIQGLSIGMYYLRLDDGKTLKFVKK